MSFSNRAQRLKNKLGRANGEPLLIAIIHDPVFAQLGLAMTSDREALIGADHFEASPEESTQRFHTRMKEIARERGAFVVRLGDKDNTKPQVWSASKLVV